MAEGEDCSEGRQRGRPSIEMDSDEVEFLLSKGFSKSKLAEMLGVQPFQKGSYIGLRRTLDQDLHEYKTSAPSDHVVIRSVHLCHTACHMDITL